MSFHAAQTFTFGEQPSATKWQYVWDNDYALADGTGISNNAILARHITPAILTNAMLSTAAGELGGAWNTWTPTFSNSAGSVTVNVTRARYTKIGKTIAWAVVCNITAASAPGSLSMTPPVNSQSSGQWAGGGREDSSTGKSLQVLFKSGASQINILFYDNAGNTCTNGYSHVIGGTYESA